MRATLVSFLKDKLRLATALVLIPAGLSIFSSFHWLLELTSHFLPHYCAALTLCSLALLCFRERWWSLAAAVGAILTGAPIAPWYFGGDNAQIPADGTPFRILLSN